MPRVLFIAGNGRSGSTLLHNLLGQMDDVVPVGELRHIWNRAVLDNQTCGCGVRFDSCEFWGDVMDLAFGGSTREFAHSMVELTESFRLQDLPRMAIPAMRRGELARLDEYLDRLSRLYAAIGEVSGARVIVDSSKNPSYGYLLRYVAGVDPYYLHFVRDSPAVAYSWGKVQEFEPGVPMARKSATASALQWMARNVSAELVLKSDPSAYRFLRYEDFVLRPRDYMESILRWVGKFGAELPFTSAHEVTMDRRNHSVFGNRVRFHVGPVTVRKDERWRTAFPRKDQLVVEVLTSPLRLRYGYLRRSDVDDAGRSLADQAA